VEIPEMVGAKDGFEEEEKSTGAAEEQDLAARMERVQMQQEQELAWERQNVDEAMAHVQMQQQYLQQRYTGRVFSAEVQQQATNLESELQRLLGIKSEVEAAKHVSLMDLGKDDMIPAIHDLSGLEVSFGSASHVSMTAGDSVLGKRPTADKHEQTDQDLNLALSLMVKILLVGSRSGVVHKAWRRGQRWITRRKIARWFRPDMVNRRDPLCGLASRNELPMLELSRCWRGFDSSRACLSLPISAS
jgi:hypothetical protein